MSAASRARCLTSRGTSRSTNAAPVSRKRPRRYSPQKASAHAEGNGLCARDHVPGGRVAHELEPSAVVAFRRIQPQFGLSAVEINDFGLLAGTLQHESEVAGVRHLG